MAKSKRGLGKGLGALIPEPTVFMGGRTIVNIDVHKTIPNPRQPRSDFPHEALNELTESIRSQGIIEPVLARMRNGRYELVAGERRWRAAKKAGLSMIPAIVKDFTDEESLEISLIENLQREDLNPIEEADAYHRLSKEFKLSQGDIAKKVGKDRSTVANMMRLLELPREIQGSLKRGQISVGHARPLLSVSSNPERVAIWREILKNNLTVRDVEQLVASGRKIPLRKTKRRKLTKNEELNDLTELLTTHLGTKVNIYGSRSRGKIEIQYFSQEDLERLIELITGGII